MKGFKITIGQGIVFTHPFVTCVNVPGRPLHQILIFRAAALMALFPLLQRLFIQTSHDDCLLIKLIQSIVRNVQFCFKLPANQATITLFF